MLFNTLSLNYKEQLYSKIYANLLVSPLLQRYFGELADVSEHDQMLHFSLSRCFSILDHQFRSIIQSVQRFKYSNNYYLINSFQFERDLSNQMNHKASINSNQLVKNFKFQERVSRTKCEPNGLYHMECCALVILWRHVRILFVM